MKYSIVLTALITALTLCGCGGREAAVIPPQEAEEQEQTVENDRPGEEDPAVALEEIVTDEESVEEPDVDEILREYYQDQILKEYDEIKNPELEAPYMLSEKNIYSEMPGKYTQLDVGDYEGEEGIVAGDYTDMDMDGNDELVVFYREKRNRR